MTHTNDRGPAPDQTEMSDMENCNTQSGVLFPEHPVNIADQLKKCCA